MKLLSNEKREKSTVELTIEVSGDEFEAAIEAAYRKQRGKILIQGFRKGKAPRKMIERMYGDNFFWEDAVNDSYGDYFDAAVAEAGLNAVGKPDMEVVDISKDGYTLKAMVPVMPEISLSGSFKGIEAVKYSATVDPKEADDEIERMRKRNARIETVTRNIKKGDTAIIDFEGFVDDVAFEGGKGEGHSLEIGSGSFIPGFEDQLVGKKAGESCDVNVTFPEEYQAPELAGKEAVFKCTVHEVKQSVLPEVDDEFAKDVSEFDTLEELKTDITQKILENRESTTNDSYEGLVMEKLSTLVEGEIPDAMIEAQVDSLLENMSYRLQSQGIDFNTYMNITGMTPEQMRQEYLPRAEQQVKLGLALEKIAEDEKLEVGAEDVDAEYNKLAEQYKIPLEQVKILIAEENLRRDMVREKASKLVMEHAVALPPEETPADKPKKAPAKKKPAAKNGDSAKADDKAEASEKPAKPAAKAPAKKKAAPKTTDKADNNNDKE